MNTVERQKKIQELLANKDFMSVEDLSGTLQASMATIRRDLTALEENGVLTRYRGGAVLSASSSKKALNIELRMDQNREVKERIARKAASLIKNGEIIFIDSSSTTYYMIDYILARDVTVVTNAIVLPALLMQKNIRTYMLGGFVDTNCNCVLGEQVTSQIKNMSFSKCFIGTFAVEENRGFTTYEMAEASLKTRLLRSSRESFVLADSSKFSAKGFITYAPLDAATIITDREPVNPSAYPKLLIAK